MSEKPWTCSFCTKGEHRFCFGWHYKVDAEGDQEVCDCSCEQALKARVYDATRKAARQP